MRPFHWEGFTSNDKLLDADGKTSRQKLLEYLDAKGTLVVLDPESYNNLGENFGITILYIEDMHNYAESVMCK